MNDNSSKKDKVKAGVISILVHVAIALLLAILTLSVAQPDKDKEDGVPVLLGNVEDAGGEDLGGLPADASGTPESTDAPESTDVPEEADPVPVAPPVRQKRLPRNALLKKPLARKPQRRLPRNVLQKKLLARKQLKRLLARKPLKRLPRNVLPKRLLARKPLKRLPRSVLPRKPLARRLRLTVRLLLQPTAVWQVLSAVATRETAATQRAMAHKVHPMVIAIQVLRQEQAVLVQAHLPLVSIQVSASGSVISASVTSSTTSSAALKNAALAAAKQSRFSEGDHTESGTITYRFKLR